MAQPPNLVPLNTSFGGSIIFKVDQLDRLVMDHVDQGTRIRQDIVRIEDLDPDAVSFSAEEHAVVLKCVPNKAQCISKEIFKLDVVRSTSRVTLAVPPDDPDGARSVQQLRTAIQGKSADQAQTGVETSAHPRRKNVR